MKTEFTFAGFTWPRQVVRMACGPAALRKKWSGRKYCGEYYHSPKPESAGTGRGFYLDAEGQPFTRWKWADDVINLKHRGWYCDDYQDQTIRGIVVMLPHGRYLAGHSLGAGMSSSVDGDIYDTDRDAALAADALAEFAAEQEREYQLEKLA